jgi:hypothetical protein
MFLEVQKRMLLVSLLLVMLQIMFIVKRLPLLEQVVWQLWMRNDIWLR